jgi:hypothetical protein
MADPGLAPAPGEESGGCLTLGGSSSVEVSLSPETIDDWVLNVGDNVYSTAQTNVTINATLDSGDDAQLDVKEMASGGNLADGKMYSSSLNAALGDELELDATTTGANDIAALNGTDQTLYTLSATGSQKVDFDYKQAIAYTDAAKNDYGIVVTFTGKIVPGS